MEYTTLDTAEKLRLAQDTLHGQETNHFRLTLVPENATPGQIEATEEQIERLREDVAQLQEQAEEERRTDEPVPEPIPDPDPAKPPKE